MAMKTLAVTIDAKDRYTNGHSARVPDYIINKNSYLTNDEFEVVKTHPVIGADILKNISEVIGGIEVGARWHHERYGGDGYPNGLEGEQIIVKYCNIKQNLS